MQQNRISSVPVGPFFIGQNAPPVLIAGPCVIENERDTVDTALFLARLGEKLQLPVVFKGSYDKANRTSPESFRGPGLQEGLRILQQAGAESGLPLLTDIHTAQQAAAAAAVVDMLQIPAFLSRQTDLITAAAETGKPLNIKKGQFLHPDDIRFAVQKAQAAGNSRVTVTERGTVFGYNNLINDMRAIPLMQRYAPVIFDATHSVQQPGNGGVTGGDREFVPLLCRAAAAAGCDALYLEVHPRPEAALSDSGSQFPLAELEQLLQQVMPIAQLVRKGAPF